MNRLFAHVKEESRADSLENIKRKMSVDYRLATQTRNALIDEMIELDVDTRELTSLYARMASNDGFKTATQVQLENDFYFVEIEAFAANDGSAEFTADEKAIIHQVATMAATDQSALETVREFITEHANSQSMSYVS